MRTNLYKMDLNYVQISHTKQLIAQVFMPFRSIFLWQQFQFDFIERVGLLTTLYNQTFFLISLHNCSNYLKLHGDCY